MGKKLRYDTFSDVMLAPAKSIFPIYGGGLVEPHKYPRYCRHLRYGLVSSKPITLSQKPVPKLPLEANKPYIFGGVYMHHFGRFVTQSIHRLWITDHPDYADHTVLFIARPEEIPLRPHFAAVMRIFGVRNWRVITSEHMVEQLVIAEQAKIFGLPPRKRNNFYLNQLRDRNGLVQTDSKHKKIAILRGHLDGRRYVAEHHLQAYLADQGYSIFCPEKHPLSKQLSFISNAEKIIISDGSACHLFDMLPPVKAEVVFLARSKFSRLGKTSIKAKAKRFFSFTKVTTLIVPISSKGTKRRVKALLFAPLPEVVHFLKAKGFLPGSAPAISSPPYVSDAKRYVDEWSKSLPEKYQQEHYLTRLVNKAERRFKKDTYFSVYTQAVRSTIILPTLRLLNKFGRQH